MRNPVLCRLVAACCPCLLPVASGEVTVSSPNGQAVFRLTAGNGRLEYSITLAGKPAVETSPVGIAMDQVNLALGAAVGNAERYQVNESYPWFGNYSTAVNYANGARIPVTNPKTGSRYTLEVRAYDGGIAFRHIVPGSGTRVPDEATAFMIPSGSVVWTHDLENHYEAQHVRKSIGAVAPGEWLAPPVTVQLPQGAGYISITEGALVDYSGMVLQGDGGRGLHARLGHAAPPSYPFRLRYAKDVERLSKPAAITGPVTTPWRVVLMGVDLNALVNSGVVHHVAPPPDAGLFPDGLKTAWLRPGRALWSYLDGGNNTVEEMMQWAGMARELGFEYNVLEGFWSRWPEEQLKELAGYSRERGVGLLLWRHSNQLRTPESRARFFDLCVRTGVAGAKIDFFDHEHKEVIDLYYELLRMAAERKLVIDFHGSNKPTGMERTWPNMLGFEGVRGMEMRPPYAMHDVTLPFTRMLAGLADYTPTHFGARKRADTTAAHQVANAILLTAPLLVYAAHPANLLSSPAAGMIKSIPATWDETVVLPASSIGNVAAFARRKGSTWFLAVNNGPVETSVHISLSFLGQGSYSASLIRDAAEASAMQLETMTARASDTLYIRMSSGGGFVARFEK